MCERLLRLNRCVVVVLLLSASPVCGFDANGDPSLVGWWTLDDGGGTIAVDSSPSGNNGTLNGDPQWVTGWLGGALEFDGDDHVDTGNADDLANYTFAVWAISPGAPSSDAPSGPIHREQNYQISWNHSNATFRGTAAMHVGGVWYAASFETLEADTWYHLAASYDGEVFKSYKNGELVTANETPSGPPTSDGNTLKLARHALAAQFFTGTVDDARVYDRVLTLEELQLVMLGGLPPELASDPGPDDEATDVSRDLILSWTAGEFAVAHDVYVGTVFDDVNDADRADPRDVLVSQDQVETAYDVGRLELGQTYYWRIDEVNGAPDNTIFKGGVWRFAVEPLGYPIENVLASSNGSSDVGAGPENTVNGSGLNEDDEHSVDAPDMWLAVPGAEPLSIQYEFDRVYKLHEMLVWNYNVQFELMLGFGLRDVTVEYSEDGTDWTVLGEEVLAQATARADYVANTAVDFGGVAARFVRLTVNAGYGPMGQFGLSEVRFLFIPAHAREPRPADGAVGVAVDAALGWRAGREAAVHEVYLGTTADALSLVDTVGDNSYTPADLVFGTTYHWKIDEVNEAEVPSVWESDVWSFATLGYAVIDDMESYDDEEDRIYDTWLDGFVNGTGSTVGYFEAPFAETTIVNGGRQSMPLEYNNSVAPFYSEAEYDLGSMNLSTNGAETLRLFVAGQAPAFVEIAEGRILMNAIGNDIWDTADQCRYAYRTLAGDGSITARVDYLDGSPNSWAKGGVMVRQSTEGGASNTYMAMTGGDGGGATYQQRMEADGSSVSQHTFADGPFTPPYWVRVTREGDTLLGYTSPDGESWTQRGDVVTLAMTDPVLIGLALTSHNVNQATSAEFSNVSFTGNVSASWEMAEIGATQPTGNDLAPLYVALEDTSGNVAVVTHPDATIVGRSGWNEWLIPYSDLAGVNLSRIAIMYIGVGDRDNPAAGGTGLIFVDDIGYGRSASDEAPPE